MSLNSPSPSLSSAPPDVEPSAQQSAAIEEEEEEGDKSSSMVETSSKSRLIYKNYNEQERALILMAMAAAKERMRNKMKHCPDEIHYHGDLDPLRDSISRELYRTFCDVLEEREFCGRFTRIPTQNSVRHIWNKFLDQGIVITKRAGVGGRKKKEL